MPKPFTATRHVNFPDGQSGTETYCLIFTHMEGDPHIEIKFRDSYMHDSINVFDHATETTRVHNWDEFRQEVAEYMATLTRDGLRLDWVNSR